MRNLYNITRVMYTPLPEGLQWFTWNPSWGLRHVCFWPAHQHSAPNTHLVHGYCIKASKLPYFVLSKFPLPLAYSLFSRIAWWLTPGVLLYLRDFHTSLLVPKLSWVKYSTSGHLNSPMYEMDRGFVTFNQAVVGWVVSYREDNHTES